MMTLNEFLWTVYAISNISLLISTMFGYFEDNRIRSSVAALFVISFIPIINTFFVILSIIYGLNKNKQ